MKLFTYSFNAFKLRTKCNRWTWPLTVFIVLTGLFALYAVPAVVENVEMTLKGVK